jgi:nucleoside-diphosphate-sugar epimerase
MINLICKMKQKILLIGGTGVLSTDVMNLSLKKGYAVYILNRGYHTKFIPRGVILLQADIKNANEVNSVIKDLCFDVVVDFITYNIKNSLSLFQNRCSQFILISSACAYRRDKLDGIITEESPLGNHNWDYSTNKVACEEYLISKCSEVGLKYSIVRPYITYGNTRLPYGIMPPYGWHWTLIARILNDKPVFLWDNGAAICTITHTADFAKGLVGLFGNPKTYNEAFHIVSDESISWKELIYLIGKLINKKPLIAEIPSVYAAAKLPFLKGMLLGDRSLDAVFDNSKIKNAVPEFICTTPLEKGISQTIEYYRANNFLKGIDYKWDAQMDKLIYDYLKEISPDKLKGLNLKFVKYLEGSFKGKLMYCKYRYFPNPVELDNSLR